MNFLAFVIRLPFAKPLLRKLYTPKDLPVNFCGIRFRNPVGLAAGFDKNAKYLKVLSVLGFGFVEIGTVTPLPQSGNEKPRLFRLPKDKAIINRMGFNNDGMEVVAARLKKFRAGKAELIVGGNIGKNKVTSNEDAWLDYEKCFLTLFDVVDYFVVNVSSPNTPGLRDLQQKDALKKILSHLQYLNSTRQKAKPILLKIAPDLDRASLDDIIDLALEIKLDGLVATNTTIARTGLTSSSAEIEQAGNGGLSGKPLFIRSNDVLKYISDRTQNQIPVLGSGGIINADDALQKMKQGATMLQIYTGFIYSGPSLVKKIIAKLKDDQS